MKYKLIKSEFNIKENPRLTFHQNITGEIDKNKHENLKYFDFYISDFSCTARTGKLSKQLLGDTYLSKY